MEFIFYLCLHGTFTSLVDTDDFNDGDTSAYDHFYCICSRVTHPEDYDVHIDFYSHGKKSACLIFTLSEFLEKFDQPLPL